MPDSPQAPSNLPMGEPAPTPGGPVDPYGDLDAPATARPSVPTYNARPIPSAAPVTRPVTPVVPGAPVASASPDRPSGLANLPQQDLDILEDIAGEKKGSNVGVVVAIVAVVILVVAASAAAVFFFLNSRANPIPLGNTNTNPPVNTEPTNTNTTPAPVAPVDTDRDRLSDEQEVQQGTDPNNPDSDGDGLLDGEEIRVYRTSPTNQDSDGDTFLDGNEVRAGYNPAGEGKLFDVNSPR